MNIPFSPPDITRREIELVSEVLRSGWVTTGPKTKEFEKKLAEYAGTKTFVCLASATAAMEMTLRLLGIGPGDEVIVPAYTYTASCSVICHVGAKPVIVDISKDSFEMDYDALDEYINENTKAIVPVDLGGAVCDFDKIYNCVERNKDKFVPAKEIQKAFGRIVIMSDCAHGFGAEKNGIKTGNFADFTCYSFHAVKNLTTVEGGAVTWKNIAGFDNEEIYKQYMNLSLHGQTKDALNKNKAGAWEYDIVSPAYKCNMTDLQGAIGLAQLERYETMLERRKTIINRYNSILDEYNVTYLKHETEEYTSSGHLYLMHVNGIDEAERNNLINSFAEKGVATNVHYKPLPMLTAYQNLGYDIKDFPNAFNYYKNEITLPLYSKMTDEELDYVVSVIEEVLKEYKK